MLYPCTAPHPADLSLLSARVALIYPCSAPVSRSFIPAQRPHRAALSRGRTLGPKRSQGLDPQSEMFPWDGGAGQGQAGGTTIWDIRINLPPNMKYMKRHIGHPMG